MNNTIDFNTAKTIGTMSKKIDHIDDTMSCSIAPDLVSMTAPTSILWA